MPEPKNFLEAVESGIQKKAGEMPEIKRVRVFPTKHPLSSNPDGSVSNVILSGEDVMTPDNKYSYTVAFPTMIEGKRYSKEQAYEIAKKNGLDKYPRFSSVKEMNAWAEANHGNIDEEGYLKKPTR